MPIKLTSAQIDVKPVSSWTPIEARHILDASGSVEISGNRGNALGFGDTNDLKLSLLLAEEALASVPKFMPIRATFLVNGVGPRAFTGIVTTPRRTLKKRAWSLECEGVRKLVSTTRPHSTGRYRRPVATRTTIASVEDPDDPAYQAGMINEALWRSGGRPAEQDFLYPDALFYYSCEQALIAPDWTWLAGEDAWTECLQLARAAGGQLFQGGDGVVYYRQPLSFASGSISYTFTASVYKDIEEETPTDQVATKIVCSYTPRTARPTAEIVNDSTPRQVEAGATITVELEPKYPIPEDGLEFAQGSTTQLATSAIQATFYDERAVPQGSGGYTHTVDVSAQKIVLTITNTTSRPFKVNKIVLRAQMIVPGEVGRVTAGSGTIERTLEENVFVQTRSHAQILVDMTLAFYGVERPMWTLTGCPFDPARTVGETVGLTVPPWGLSNAPCLIVAIRYSKTGRTCDYTLVSLAGLPQTGNFFLVGSNYTGQSKQLSW